METPADPAALQDQGWRPQQTQQLSRTRVGDWFKGRFSNVLLHLNILDACSFPFLQEHFNLFDIFTQ